jgi:hypothetical protein
MKHKLRIEQLSVESFASTRDSAEIRGTVQGNQSDPNTCYPVICYSGEPSCLGTCPPEETCGLSCGGTCIPSLCDDQGS